MIDFISQYLWWILWLVITPLIIFLGVVHFLIVEFEKFKLHDYDMENIELDELDRDNIQ